MGEQTEEIDMELDETALQELYTWIDGIPLSRPKKNISRDFSDGGIIRRKMFTSSLPSFHHQGQNFKLVWDTWR